VTRYFYNAIKQFWFSHLFAQRRKALFDAKIYQFFLTYKLINHDNFSKTSICLLVHLVRDE